MSLWETDQIYTLEAVSDMQTNAKRVSFINSDYTIVAKGKSLKRRDPESETNCSKGYSRCREGNCRTHKQVQLLQQVVFLCMSDSSTGCSGP